MGNESCNASKLRTHDALDKAVSKGDLSGMLTWVEFPENQPLADRIQKANRLRAVGNLRHVNIPLVRASGISSTSGCVQLVCERVPSTTVNSYLLSEAPTGVDLNTARIWCIQVLDALVL